MYIFKVVLLACLSLGREWRVDLEKGPLLKVPLDERES